MTRPLTPRWPALGVALSFALVGGLLPASASAQEAPPPPQTRQPVATPTVEGPLPGGPPGDPASEVLEETYPFFATDLDLAANGYVEEEFIYSGEADAYDRTGALLEEDVPYRTRMIVRRPVRNKDFSGTVLAEWQNVTAGYDLDALWNAGVMREGHAWVGVSAQRVGVDQLREWSPVRYGDLDVTGDGAFTADELSYDIFAQAGKALEVSGTGVHPLVRLKHKIIRAKLMSSRLGRMKLEAIDARRAAQVKPADPLGDLRAKTILAIGASQSAGRMTVHYNSVLPQTEAVFDGYGFIVGSAPEAREDEGPVFHVLSETDVRTPTRMPDTDVYRRWEVAGTAHSGWEGQAYRRSLSERDLGAVPEYECDQPPFSRVPMTHVLLAAYDHLADWARTGELPPTAPPLEFNEDGTKVRNELGLAQGGIQLSQVKVPTALNTGDNSGASFCRLFGTHIPFDEETLDELYPTRGSYVGPVTWVSAQNASRGYILRADARDNVREALASDVGR